MSDIFNRSSQTERRRLLRDQPTVSEQILWKYLRKEQLEGFKFRRQYGVGPYIVDFYCVAASLVIEVDGDSHGTEEARKNDEVRQREIEALGLRVLRFTNEDVRERIDAVLEKIMETCRATNRSGTSTVPPPLNPLLR